MNPPQSYRSPEPSGLRTNAVRLCVALLGFWIVASSLLLQSPVSQFSLPAAQVSSVGSDLLTVGFEKHGSESGDCCLEVDCSDSQDCSLPCVSSCPAPQVAVLESPLFRDLSSGANIASVVDNKGFVSPVVTLLFRPPIV
ncbi:hypothetical protein IMCC3135_16435 [Granulosicoccus antarcticus IMCC3135]|uniref:Uncharacterized protein n=2 Tax=Granulosicoccus TaxID=437504 RepID=A0A2Z2NQ15_9GAMM|nr:hypothetical protein IMCC3135_16435 [Granulosicoccus antarcticus IMCC3135]